VASLCSSRSRVRSKRFIADLIAVMQRFYPIGTPGQPWANAELAQWRAQQYRHCSYALDVLAPLQAMHADKLPSSGLEVFSYGELTDSGELFPLMAVRSATWRSASPSALITGGVHGYETSGVHGALRFLQLHSQHYAGRVNLLVAPCVSPWAYERIQRWNADARDPNRSFKQAGLCQEAALLMHLVASTTRQWALHIDLHETTDTDESEFRPALAARDGKLFEPCIIPDGFYLVDDAGNPQPAFQQAIIAAVERVTHIAPGDATGCIIGSPQVARGVIQYELQGLGLCASITGARYTTTTEVYPDSPRATPEQCIQAQVAAVCAALDYMLASSS
jgi:hypothetical protein